ncbi:MAG: DNA methyltransferase [Acidobacteriota bacterium]
MRGQRGLFEAVSPHSDGRAESFVGELRAFVYDGRRTDEGLTNAGGRDGPRFRVPTFVNEFWTSRQRSAHSLHEVSYRACFKPQLPRFFIERLTAPGDVVYDPFMGRGTTLLEAALLERRVAGCDVNPLSRILVGPRLRPPMLARVRDRLDDLDLTTPGEEPRELEVFYHPETLAEICALRDYLLRRSAAGLSDEVDDWVRMVAVNRLTGHSPGFFSVYTLPPNQAASIESQRKINVRRHQVPPRRDVKAIILKKTRSLLADGDGDLSARLQARATPVLVTGSARRTPELADGSVDLVVTSPPFLDVVDYAGDNWLRCWFCGIDPNGVDITIARRLDQWARAMAEVLVELHRVVRPAGRVAFEVGEVRRGTVRLEEAVIPAAASAGWTPEAVVINTQVFTKTANCWGVTNNAKGTNTNRIVVLRRG